MLGVLRLDDEGVLEEASEDIMDEDDCRMEGAATFKGGSVVFSR